MYNDMVITYIVLFYIYRFRLVNTSIVTYIVNYSHRYMCYMHDARYDNNIIN